MSNEHPSDVRAAHIGAVSTRAAAAIGAAAVLLSGLLSLGAGILSANIAGASAVRATALQLSGESEKSRAEFLRGQRQKAYASIIADHQYDMKQLRTKPGYAYSQTSNPLDGQRIRGTIDRFGLGQNRLATHRVTVQLIGSSQASRAAGRLSRAHYLVYYHLTELLHRMTHSPNLLKVNKALLHIERLESKARDAQDAFLKVARADLGATD